MGLIHFDLLATLDLVAQAPGGPEEDTEGGFKFGGWQVPFPDEVVGKQVAAAIARMDALLLGRKTYEIFAGYWPHQEDGVDSEIARKFNRIPKYVASRSKLNLEWGRFVAGRIRCCDIRTRNSRSTRERPGSRLRQEGFRERDGAVESDACRTCVD